MPENITPEEKEHLKQYFTELYKDYEEEADQIVTEILQYMEKLFTQLPKRNATNTAPSKEPRDLPGLWNANRIIRPLRNDKSMEGSSETTDRPLPL